MPSALWLRLLIAAGFLALLIGGVLFGPDVMATLTDADRLQTAIAGLGGWGPLALIVLSAVQIIIAPIPGYLVQIAGGYLFGAVVGGVYGIVGMMMGAAAAFALGRRFGIPLLERLLPPRLLGAWLSLRGLDSTWAWVVTLLLPVGDFCYFLAGLTALSIWRMLLVTLVVRGPVVVLASYAGAQAATLSAPAVALIIIAIVVLTVIVLWQKDRLETLIVDRLLARFLGKRDKTNDAE